VNDAPEANMDTLALRDQSPSGTTARQGVEEDPPLQGNAKTPVGAAPAEAPQHKPRGVRRIVGIAALAAGVAAAAWFGYDWYANGRFLVSTDDAYVRADVSIISAKVAGYITAVPVTDNTRVRAGDLIAQIDTRDYQVAVDAARNRIATQDATIARLKEQAKAQGAVIEQAKAQVTSASASAARAQGDFERAQALVQRDFASRQQFDQARAERDQTQASVKSAEAAELAARTNLDVLNAQVAEAERSRAELQTNLDKALLDLSYATVKAPVDGVVGNKAVQVGQYVQPGTRLLALVPLGSAYVEANYKETQLAGIRPGQKARVSIDAAGGRTVDGVVESIAPASGSQFSLLPPENATGNFTKIVQRVPVRIRVPETVLKDEVLRPGLSVVTSIDTRSGSRETASR
jgi:membrane fusion protein (multidrug efflux system)